MDLQIPTPLLHLVFSDRGLLVNHGITDVTEGQVIVGVTNIGTESQRLTNNQGIGFTIA